VSDQVQSFSFYAFAVTGKTIPPVTPLTERTFLEAIDTLTFPEPWHIPEFREVLDHLKADGYDLFEGEFIDQPSRSVHGRPHWNANKTAPRSGNPDL
jgi:hypothetical protein